uniref:Uncharacterized protein n=1 Tax=Ganoderma boninense TaxID=34458 RepID=A0A5K1K1S0_9APHY|nr:Uncharacterized protein [Ganoderma boninense]
MSKPESSSQGRNKSRADKNRHATEEQITEACTRYSELYLAWCERPLKGQPRAHGFLIMFRTRLQELLALLTRACLRALPGFLLGLIWEYNQSICIPSRVFDLDLVEIIRTSSHVCFRGVPNVQSLAHCVLHEHSSVRLLSGYRPANPWWQDDFSADNSTPRPLTTEPFIPPASGSVQRPEGSVVAQGAFKGKEPETGNSSGQASQVLPAPATPTPAGRVRPDVLPALFSHIPHPLRHGGGASTLRRPVAATASARDTLTAASTPMTPPTPGKKHRKTPRMSISNPRPRQPRLSSNLSATIASGSSNTPHPLPPVVPAPVTPTPIGRDGIDVLPASQGSRRKKAEQGDSSRYAGPSVGLADGSGGNGLLAEAAPAALPVSSPTPRRSSDKPKSPGVSSLRKLPKVKSTPGKAVAAEANRAPQSRGRQSLPDMEGNRSFHSHEFHCSQSTAPHSTIPTPYSGVHPSSPDASTLQTPIQGALPKKRGRSVSRGRGRARSAPVVKKPRATRPTTPLFEPFDHDPFRPQGPFEDQWLVHSRPCDNCLKARQSCHVAPFRTSVCEHCTNTKVRCSLRFDGDKVLSRYRAFIWYTYCKDPERYPATVSTMAKINAVVNNVPFWFMNCYNWSFGYSKEARKHGLGAREYRDVHFRLPYSPAPQEGQPEAGNSGAMEAAMPVNAGYADRREMPTENIPGPSGAAGANTHGSTSEALHPEQLGECEDELAGDNVVPMEGVLPVQFHGLPVANPPLADVQGSSTGAVQGAMLALSASARLPAWHVDISGPWTSSDMDEGQDRDTVAVNILDTSPATTNAEDNVQGGDGREDPNRSPLQDSLPSARETWQSRMMDSGGSSVQVDVARSDPAEGYVPEGSPNPTAGELRQQIEGFERLTRVTAIAMTAQPPLSTLATALVNTMANQNSLLQRVARLEREENAVGRYLARFGLTAEVLQAIAADAEVKRRGAGPSGQ